jgi:hypothetical protein
MTNLSTETLEKFLELEKSLLYPIEGLDMEEWTDGEFVGYIVNDGPIPITTPVDKEVAEFIIQSRTIAPQAVRELIEARELLKAAEIILESVKISYGLDIPLRGKIIEFLGE